MKNKVCPNCGWRCNTLRTLRQLNKSRIKSRITTRYVLQCNHCKWKTKESFFKHRAWVRWNQGDGSFTTAKERKYGIFY